MKDNFIRYFCLTFIFFNYVLSEESDSLKTVAGYSCSACHVESGWTPISPTEFSHNLTSFPLSGFHKYVDCISCHVGSTLEERHTFTNVLQNCNECHLDVHNSQLGSFCSDCHSTRSWEVTSKEFRHESTAFPLIGAHRFVSCQSCHESANSGNYYGLSTDCISCHNQEYSANDSHEFYPTSCEICHNTSSWQESVFDHNETEFPLLNSHIEVDCSECHTDVYVGTTQNCDGCHLEEYQATFAPPHEDQIFQSEDCASCHDATIWDSTIFEHDVNSTNCNECHNANYEIANVNVEGHNEFSEDCTTCHTTQNWQENIFDHNTTNFELVGNHIETDCSACHSHGFENTTTECSICHLEDYSNTEFPPHLDEIYLPNDCEQCHTPINWDNEFIHDDSIQMCNTCHKMDLIDANENIEGHGDLSINCTECHNMDNWLQVEFDHNQTNYPLTGMHQNTQCSLCHTESFQNTQNLCENCHEEDYFETSNPIHNEQIYQLTECENCHSTFNWEESIFSHTENSDCYTCHQFDYSSAIPNHTDYELDCLSCHLGTETWEGAGFDHESTVDACITCHDDDQTFAIENIGGHDGFPDNCIECHITESWTENVFDHNLTSFPLLDSHGGLDCTECHTIGFDYETMPTECEFCHFNDYINTTNPVHWEQEYIIDECELCHNATTWTNVIFAHNQTESACVTCHQITFTQASNPDHTNLNNDCELCHNSTDNWQDAEFNHVFTTDGCIDCHLSEYEISTEPNHIELNYSTNCETCHTTDTWLGATFDHTSISDGCYDCHQADYNSTTDPNHVNEGYSTDCESCHIVDNWDTVDPHTNASGNCNNCHNYNGLDGETNPDIDHNTAPKLGDDINDCELCHNSTSNWRNINFEDSNKHDNSTYNIYFNINSGDHNNEWSNCTTDCHVFGDFDTFSCYESCHEDPEHNVSSPRHGNESCSGSNGYWNIGSVQWSTGSLTNPSSFDQCYSCHPNGSNSGPCGD